VVDLRRARLALGPESCRLEQTTELMVDLALIEIALADDTRIAHALVEESCFEIRREPDELALLTAAWQPFRLRPAVVDWVERARGTLELAQELSNLPFQGSQSSQDGLLIPEQLLAGGGGSIALDLGG